MSKIKSVKSASSASSLFVIKSPSLKWDGDMANIITHGLKSAGLLGQEQTVADTWTPESDVALVWAGLKDYSNPKVGDYWKQPIQIFAAAGPRCVDVTSEVIKLIVSVDLKFFGFTGGKAGAKTCFTYSNVVNKIPHSLVRPSEVENLKNKLEYIKERSAAIAADRSETWAPQGVHFDSHGSFCFGVFHKEERGGDLSYYKLTHFWAMLPGFNPSSKELDASLGSIGQTWAEKFMQVV